MTSLHPVSKGYIPSSIQPRWLDEPAARRLPSVPAGSSVEQVDPPKPQRHDPCSALTLHPLWWSPGVSGHRPGLHERGTLTDRDATDPAPRLEALRSHVHPASLRASRSVNVARSADQRVGFVTWIVFTAVMLELAYRVTW